MTKTLLLGVTSEKRCALNITNEKCRAQDDKCKTLLARADRRKTLRGVSRLQMQFHPRALGDLRQVANFGNGDFAVLQSR